jgi:hypothetical protein
VTGVAVEQRIARFQRAGHGYGNLAQAARP